MNLQVATAEITTRLWLGKAYCDLDSHSSLQKDLAYSSWLVNRYAKGRDGYRIKIVSICKQKNAALKRTRVNNPFLSNVLRQVGKYLRCLRP